ASSMARRAPFSLSLPKCAIWPVSGPTCPILISCAAGAGDALVASAAVFAAGFGCSPQAMSAAAAAISVAPTLLFMRSSRGLRGRAYDTARPGWHSRRALARYHLVTVVSLLRQDPLHQRAHVRVWHVRIGRHRHLPPGSLAALLHLVDELRFRAGVATVFRRDILVGRADQLLVDGVAGEAGVLLGELFLRMSRQRHRNGDGRGQDECETLHACSLRVFFKCTRSLIGARQVTPRHSHALTGSARGGLSSTAPRPGVPSGSASTVRSGRNSRTSSACHAGSASPRPRRISVRGGWSASSRAMLMAAKPAG